MKNLRLRVMGLGLVAVMGAACGDAGLDPDELIDDPIVDPPVDESPILEDPVDELVAPFDNDSAADPAVDEFLSITGQRELAYTDQISAEDGDPADYVQFELPNNSNTNQRVTVSLDCDIYGDETVTARVELSNVDRDGSTRITGPPIDCNEGEFFVTVQNDQVQSARIYIQGAPDAQTLVEYTFIVEAF